MTDSIYARLIAECNRLGDELDAAHDGALHRAYGDAAYRMMAAIEHKYDAAQRALSAYRDRTELEHRMMARVRADSARPAPWYDR